MLNGQIDHCWGRYVYGWAIPTKPGTRCRIIAVDPYDEVIAETRADLPRGDLLGVGAGECDFAFELGLPFTEVTGPFRILADDIEVPGSPLFMEPDMLAGEIAIEGGRVTGWVANRHSVTVTQPVTLTDQDGHVVLTVVPAASQADEDPLFRPGRFDAALPERCFGRNELCLTARIGDVVIAQCFGPARLEGYLDALTGKGCVGWLFSPDAPDRRFNLVIHRDGKPAGAVTTGLLRPDVGSRFPGAEACGFDMPMKPRDTAPSGMEHVSIRFAGSDRELFGGPFMIGHPSVAVEQAHLALTTRPRAAGAEAAILDAFALWFRSQRTASELRIKARRLPASRGSSRRLSVVIPVYADVEATRTCIDSVLRCRNAETDTILIVNDNPADPEMTALAESQKRHPNLFVLHNGVNQGFVASANRGMDFLQDGDVLLLNADTEMFPGALDEMHHVLESDPAIGSVTAISNNATLFSYPHPDVIVDALDDASWADVAAICLQENAGATAPIPTGHGFCMLIRRAVIEDIGLFDPAFGRGYGEENDFSLRAADRGWQHVAAGGVFVHHAEARSFGPEKARLVARNLEVLAQRFPEYTARIARFAAADPIRRLRWPIDAARLRKAATNRRLWLVIDNWLDGGTARAASDIAALVTAPDVVVLSMTGHQQGHITLEMEGLALRTVFAADEGEPLVDLLSSLPVERIVVHHLMGFTQAVLDPLQRLLAACDSVFHVHDFYYACPRVTMIDATGSFCGGSTPDRCDRCIALDGAHAAHRLNDLSVAEHRDLFRSLLLQSGHAIAPSRDAAARLGALLPHVSFETVAHPQIGTTFPIGVRRGRPTEICLLGAIGPHKGSRTLLALARHAALNHPEFRFHVVGFTNIDKDLEAVGNVTITGRYEPADLPALVEKTESKIALFLHTWPETFSYTLTEAVSLGMIPVVPDIGAPADRIRDAGFGVVFPFPIDIASVMATLVGVANGSVAFSRDGGLPLGFDTGSSHERMRRAYTASKDRVQPSLAKMKRRNVAGK